MYQKLRMMMTALALIGVTAGQATAATVSLTAPNPILTAGSPTLDLNLVGADFTAISVNGTTGVDGGAFTFNWDPTVLQ